MSQDQICKHCGLPIFHGVVSTTLSQCKCQWTTKYPEHAIGKLSYEQLEYLNSALRDKCAELEKDVQVAKGQYEGACIIIKKIEKKCTELMVERDNLREQYGKAFKDVAELKRQLEEAAKQEPNAAVERMVLDFPTLMEFYRKHGLGPMMPPSCLCCGKRTYPAELGHPQSVAIKHAELPGIVICEDCRIKVSTPINALIEQAKAEEREECAQICDDYSANFGSGMFDKGASDCADAIRARKP